MGLGTKLGGKRVGVVLPENPNPEGMGDGRNQEYSTQLESFKIYGLETSDDRNLFMNN